MRTIPEIPAVTPPDSQSMNPELVLAALDECDELNGHVKPAKKAVVGADGNEYDHMP